jgi:hypothetical protein
MSVPLNHRIVCTSLHVTVTFSRPVEELYMDADFQEVPEVVCTRLLEQLKMFFSDGIKKLVDYAIHPVFGEGGGSISKVVLRVCLSLSSADLVIE